MKLIRSPSNPLVKQLMLLRKKQQREQEQQIVVEGQRAISGFLDHGLHMHLGILRQDLSVPEGWPVESVQLAQHAVINKLSTHRSPSGYYAVFNMPQKIEIDYTLGGLILYDIQDPGNCGTLIRSAAAFGWKQVICIGGVDPWNPKAVQASVGAIAGVSVHSLEENTALQTFIEHTDAAPLAALVLAGGQNPRSMTAGKRWLVIGNEAKGLPHKEMSVCQQRVSIPMAGSVESLNAGVAGSIAASLLGLQ